MSGDHTPSKKESDGTRRSQRMSGRSQEVTNRLKAAMFLCGSFLIVEVVGGYIAGSLAVLSDAAHLFADLASFAVAIAAEHLATLPATDQHTFGLKRAESLAALLSMISLALVSVYLAAEAVRRLVRGHENVDGKLMSIVASIGVLVNISLAFVLGAEHHVHLPGAHDHDHSHDHGHGPSEHEERTGNARNHSSQKHDHDHEHAHHDDDEHDSEKNHSHGHEHSHQHDDHDDSDDSHDHEHSHQHDNHDDNDDDEDHHSHDHEHAHEPTGQERNEHSDHNHSHNHESAPLLSKVEKGYEATKGKQVDSHSHGKKEKPAQSVNLQAAYLHVVGDLMQSLGVLIAGLAIWYNPKWTIVDPISTLFFCAVVCKTTFGVVRHSVAVLLQEMPTDLSWKGIYDAIASVEGVQNVHDLHVWSISQGDPALSVHCFCGERDPQWCMKEIAHALKRMGITHVTIQIQQGNGPCITCCENEGCDAARLITKGSSPCSSYGRNQENSIV